VNPQPAAPLEALRSLLHDALVGRSEPILCAGDVVLPAVSLWAAARRWTSAFRDAGLMAGDRVVIATGASTVTAELIVACLWEGVAAVPISADHARWAMEATGARLMVGTNQPAWVEDGPGVWTVASPGVADRTDPARPASGRTGAAAMFLTVDGWKDASATYLVKMATDPRFASMAGARVVNAAPWESEPGLLAGLLAPMARGAALIVYACECDDETLTALLDEAAWAVIPAKRLERFRRIEQHRVALARCTAWMAPNGDTDGRVSVNWVTGTGRSRV
jgi:hypothetical protein